MVGMNLHEYLSRPDSMSTADLARAIGVRDSAQVRQWRYAYAKRRPEPASCVAIEQATSGTVKRWDLRPDDWHLIWPELIGADGAPEPAEAGG